MQSPAIHIHRHGGPDVLQPVLVDVPPPARGEVQIRQSAIGLNFADIYQRRGSHGPHAAVASWPVTLGAQGAGVVEAVGDGVTDAAQSRPRVTIASYAVRNASGIAAASVNERRGASARSRLCGLQRKLGRRTWVASR